MIYLPDWETLFDALYRVIRARGFNPADWPDNATDDSDKAFFGRMGTALSDLSERALLSTSERQQMWAEWKRDPQNVEYEATRDICNAIADRKIRVRFLVKKAKGKLGSPGERVEGTVRNGDEVEIPPHLHPADFDWVPSRPTEPWQRLANTILDQSSWHLEWIELRREDVTAVLCGEEGTSLPYPLSAVDPHLGDTQDKPIAGAKTRGIEEAIDQLWPNGIPKGLSAKERDNAIAAKLKDNESSVPKNIARAVQRVLKKRQSK